MLVFGDISLSKQPDSTVRLEARNYFYNLARGDVYEMINWLQQSLQKHYYEETVAAQQIGIADNWQNVQNNGLIPVPQAQGN